MTDGRTTTSPSLPARRPADVGRPAPDTERSAPAGGPRPHVAGPRTRHAERPAPGDGPGRDTHGAGVGVILPDWWWAIPLTEGPMRQRSVTALIDRQFGRDAHPALKQEVHRELSRTTRRAARDGAWLMALMMMPLGRGALGASLTVSRVPGTRHVDALDVMEATLRGGAGEGDAGVPGVTTVDVGEGPWGPMLRAVTELPPPAAPGAMAKPTLGVTYWCDPRDGDGLLLLAFSTPHLVLRDQLVDLFDAIAGTVHVPSAPLAPARVAGLDLAPTDRGAPAPDDE